MPTRPGPVAGLRKAPAADPVLGVAGTPTDRESETGAPPRPGGRRPVPATPPSKVKVGFYQDPADTARARASWVEEPLSAIGITRRTSYSLTGPFTRAARDQMQAQTKAATEARTAASGCATLDKPDIGEGG